MPTDALTRLHPATSRPSSLPTPPLDLSAPPALEDWLYLLYAPLPPEPAPSPPSPPQWWNDLPTDVRTAQSLTTFQRLLKTHLFRQHL
ncbi:UNVERIFIED_CONTAM: hypothetical protein FKN15_057847 [Acipenser sinensis]